jgi:hypothetical protein
VGRREGADLRPGLGLGQHGHGPVQPGVADRPALGYELFADENTVLRFDASDLMPGEVGAGTFWSEMTDWIALDKRGSSRIVLSGVDEVSWPSDLITSE